MSVRYLCHAQSSKISTRDAECRKKSEDRAEIDFFVVQTDTSAAGDVDGFVVETIVSSGGPR
jgi:hypothetical protein